MAPLATNSSRKSSRNNSQEIHQYEEPPIYVDVAYNINKIMRFSWYEIYE